MENARRWILLDGVMSIQNVQYIAIPVDKIVKQKKHEDLKNDHQIPNIAI